MRRRCRGALRSWRPRRGRCPLPIGQSCRTLGGPTSVARLPGREGWRVGPARGGTWGRGLVCVVCVCLFGLYCYACALHCQTVARGPTNACFGRTPSPRWDTVRDMGWWHAHRARPGRAICSATGPDMGCLCPFISRLVAPFGRLTWCPHTRLSRACAWPRWARPSAHRRRSEPSDRPDRFDPPFVPAMGNTSGAHSSEERPLRPFLGGNSRRWRLVSWSRPLTWWGMPSRGAARRSCRTRAGGHSGMGSRMRAG